MGTKLEKILNPWVLLSLNILIIVATELSGSLFEKTGIIHLIAVLFVILGVSRILVHYDAYDRYLHPLIHGGAAALIIFSASHLAEFLGYASLHAYKDAIFINVVNFYIMSMLAVTIGAEYFFRVLKKDKAAAIIVPSVGIAVFFILTALIFMNKIRVSLEPDKPLVYVYAVLVLSASFLSVNRLIQIKKHVSIMTGFVNYFIAAFILITVSALQSVFYEVIEHGLGISDLQIVYASHFLFYGALSLMFLAFALLADLGGIYKDVKKPLP